MGLKNLSSEACLEAQMDDAGDGDGTFSLTYLQSELTKAKPAEAIKFLSQLSSFYLHLKALWVSMTRRWFYPNTLLLRLGCPVHRKGRRREEKGEPSSLRMTRKTREKKKEENQ